MNILHILVSGSYRFVICVWKFWDSVHICRSCCFEELYRLRLRTTKFDASLIPVRRRPPSVDLPEVVGSGGFGPQTSASCAPNVESYNLHTLLPSPKNLPFTRPHSWEPNAIEWSVSRQAAGSIRFVPDTTISFLFPFSSRFHLSPFLLCLLPSGASHSSRQTLT